MRRLSNKALKPTGYIALVPEQEEYTPPPGTARAAAAALSHLLFLDDPRSRKARRCVLYPRNLEAEFMGFGNKYSPLHVGVEECPAPTSAFDATAFRYCRSCDALVATLSQCERCGVEEDPSAWRIGPPKRLYTRGFELLIVAEMGPDIWPRPDGEVEGAVRGYLGHGMATIESTLGFRLRMVRYVGP